MPPDLHRELLQLAALGFVVGSGIVQAVALRTLAGAGATAAIGEPPAAPGGPGSTAHTTPDPRRPILRALLRGSVVGTIPLLAVFALWAVRAWNRAGWEILVGLEILIAFALLAAGLAGIVIRAVLEVLSSEPSERVRVPIPVLRAGVLLAGWIYAGAVALCTPRGPGETLFAVAALGGACLLLGLHRLPPDAVELLARGPVDRRPRP